MNPLPSTVDWTYWRQFPTLKIWELAALMCQIDPRTLGDTTDRNGDPIDLRDEERMLIGAVNTMLITAHPALNPPRSAEPKTEVSVSSAAGWLHAAGRVEIARGLGAVAHAEGGRRNEWSADELSELYRFQKSVGTKATAKRYGISDTRVRELVRRAKT